MAPHIIDQKKHHLNIFKSNDSLIPKQSIRQIDTDMIILILYNDEDDGTIDQRSFLFDNVFPMLPKKCS